VEGPHQERNELEFAVQSAGKHVNSASLIKKEMKI